MDQPSPIDPAVLAYYEQGREQARLETACQLEFLRTQELLARFLPAAPARIVDVGGGAGIHALPLIGAGYDVTLIDPVPLHVAQARGAGVTSARVGDARRLDLPDESAEGVLLLGPLYHLTDRNDRLAALREARRIVSVDGVVVAAAISRFASTIDGLLRGFLRDPRFEQIVEHDVEDGVHTNPTSERGWFTTAFFHHPDDLSREFVDAGLAVTELVAVEGPASLLLDADEWLHDLDHREVLLRAIRRVESDRALLGASSHFLAIGVPA
jgi:SAM-dependent methyltransferase